MAMNMRSGQEHEEWPGTRDLIVARSRRYTGGQEQNKYWLPGARDILVARDRTYTVGQEQEI